MLRRFFPEAEGVNRARSASEAFLYRRLETLPETKGRFGLNMELPIPFDNRGRMEVDFFCADAGVVIELDGGQHLADAEAYRRDRRKDSLLQQNGYFILRFLAEDLANISIMFWIPFWQRWFAVRKSRRYENNSTEMPLRIYRPLLGTHERVHRIPDRTYVGHFPLWLAPNKSLS